MLLGVTAASVLAVLAVYGYAEWLAPAGVALPRGNYSRIEDGLYVGGVCAAPPPGTRAVLNVGELEDPYEAEVHRWSPIPDTPPPPSLAWLRKQVDFVATQRRAGRPVYIHCQAGISRSVMVTTAYLMYRDGIPRDQALDQIRAKRPSAGPNPAFMKLLAEWEKTLRTPPNEKQP